MNFGGLPEQYSEKNSAKIVILPVPYDGTSTWIKGADKGPSAILEASAMMELYDIETNSEIYKLGIHTAPFIEEAGSPEKVTEVVFSQITEMLDSEKFPVTLGGEHSVSIGAIKAFANKFSDLSVLQIDAHSDLRDEYGGSSCNHACVMARAKEVATIVQVGIRASGSEELPSLDPERVFFAHQIHDNEEWMDKAIGLLSDNVYITIDLDAFDPSIMPSTGTPEPGGLQWYQTLKFIKKVIEEKNVAGFDVVELCPAEHNKAPDFLAAKLIYRILSMKFKTV